MEKRIKKTLICLFLAILALTLSNIPNDVYAVSQVTTDNIEQIKPYAEEVGWFIRYVNGRKQKRLWSHTYGRWITDWIWA